MNIALYARVSTRGNGQETENQLKQLRDYCVKRKWTVVEEYIDERSGASSDRVEFKRMFSDASQRKFDLVLFWALDRFSREGVRATLRHLETLDAYGVGWKSLTEQYLDSAGVFKDAIISIMATLAKQERIRLSERTLAGLDRARAQGKQLGRPKKLFDRQKVVTMRKAGHSLGEIAKEVGISRTHAMRIARDAQLQTQ